MQIAMEKPAADRKKTIAKAGAPALFIVGAVILVRFTPVKDYLTPQALGAFLKTAGRGKNPRAPQPGFIDCYPLRTNGRTLAVLRDGRI